MLNKFIVGAIAAGVMSVPLAGVAVAKPADGGNNGNANSSANANATGTGNANGNANANGNGNGNGNSVGAGGIPGSIQSNYGLTAPVPPGKWLGQLRESAAGQPLPQWLRENTPNRSPGDIISDIAHGDFPDPTVIPAPVE